jgi:hypothetical protein
MPNIPRFVSPGCALVLTVSFVEFGGIDRAHACGGYMAEVPIGGEVLAVNVWRRQRAKLVSELRRAEAALEHGRHEEALVAIATAWKHRVFTSHAGWSDEALFDRIDAVAFAAVVWSAGAWTIADDGRVEKTSTPDESQRALTLARDRLLPLVARSKARAKKHPALALPLAAEAAAVAQVWLTEGVDEPRVHHEALWALWALYEAGGIASPEALAVVGMTARVAGNDALADAAWSLCRARAAAVDSCDQDDGAPDAPLASAAARG